MTDIVGNIENIHKKIEEKINTARLCKEILDNLIDPTQRLEQKLGELKEKHPTEYEEIRPIIDNFLWGNYWNIKIIWDFLVKSIIRIWDDSNHQTTETNLETVKWKNEEDTSTGKETIQAKTIIWKEELLSPKKLSIHKSTIPEEIKENKTKLHIFLLELKKQLAEKTQFEHFARLKINSEQVKKIEVKIIVDHYIITNTIDNIINSLSNLFFEKQWKNKDIHNMLIKIDKKTAEEFADSIEKVYREQETNDKKYVSPWKEEKNKSMIIDYEKLKQRLLDIVAKKEGRTIINDFNRHYKIKEDHEAVKKIESYKTILQSFIPEIGKITNNNNLIKKIREYIENITDKKLETPRKSFNYLSENNSGTIIEGIITIIKDNERK